MSEHKLGFWSKLLNKQAIFETPITYTPVAGKTTIPQVPEQPTSINLLRAVYDEAGTIVKRIDRDLVHIEIKKAELIKQRDAYIELFAVATKHVTQAGGK
jgi:hypothetical protein